MGDNTSIMAVTTALARRLQRAVGNQVPGTLITTERPGADDPHDKPRVNLFLFHVEPNPSLINNDLPTRSSDGQLLQSPEIGLNLDYLITFYGNETLLSLQPQQLASLVIEYLHTYPVLTVADLQNALSGREDPPTSSSSDAEHAVFLTQQSIALDSLSRLWSVTFQAPYALSLAYRASAIMLNASLTPIPVQPVETRGIHVQAIRYPLIETVLTTAPDTSGSLGDVAVLSLGDPLIIIGRALVGATTEIKVSQATLSLSGTATTDPTRLEVKIDGTGLHSGYVPVLVITDEVNVSSPVTIALLPKVLGAKKKTIKKSGASIPTLAVTMTPPPVAGAEMSIQLYASDTPSSAPISLPAARTDKGQDPMIGEISANISDVPAGQYLYRVNIGGVQSQPETDPATQQPTGPVVTMRH